MLRFAQQLLVLVAWFVIGGPLCFGLPEGFLVNRFAGPPEVTYPVGVAVAPTGEVYVSVDKNSSLDRKENMGSIVRCVDSDEDGVADQFTQYVPNIDSPRGLCFVGQTLYVVNPPFLTAFRDRDGDGVAEEKEVLIEGLGFDLSFRGADHTSNGVRMGIDGWLYLAIGDYGFLEAKAKDGSTMHLHGGGVVRIRPDGSELEPYSLFTRNIYDIGISPKMDVFSRDNTNDGKGWNTRMHHFVSLGNHGYPRLYKNFPDEILPPLADYGGGSGTGGYYLDEPGFPEDYNDAFYSCDFTTQHVYVHRLSPVEATFRAEQESFYAIKAIDMDVDGSSQMYVSDWTGGGYKFGRPDVGSISRITFPSMKAAEFPDLLNSSDRGLLSHLGSDSAVCRLNAQSEILRRGQREIFRSGLQRIIRNDEIRLYGRIAAIFTLKQLFGTEAHPFLVGTTEQAELREFALRALADRAKEIGNVTVDPYVRGLSDVDPRVRMQSVIGIARLNAVEHADKLIPLAKQPEARPWLEGDYSDNRAIPHIASKAVIALNARTACIKALSNVATREAALRCLREMHSDSVVTSLLSVLKTTEDDALKSGILGALFRLYYKDKRWDATRWWTTRPDDRGPYFEPILWENSVRIRKAVESELVNLPETHQAKLLITLRKNRINPEDFKLNLKVDEVSMLIDERNPPTIAIVPLTEATLSAAREEAVRIKAFDALGRIPGKEAFTAQLKTIEAWRMESPQTDAIKAGIQGFIQSPDMLGKPKILRDALRGEKGDRLHVIALIALHVLESPLADVQLKGLINDGLKRNRKKAEVVRAIGIAGASEFKEWVQEAADSENHELVMAGNEALDLLKAADSESTSGQLLAFLTHEEILEQTAEYRGSVEIGKGLFARQGCVACHTVSQSEAPKGPYLGDAGSKWKNGDLIQSILKPNAVVAQGFQTQWFSLKDGEIIEGFVTADVDNTIEVRNIAGIVTSVRRADIVDQGVRETSMMPEGLAASLSPEGFASLIAYLLSLK